VVHVSVLGLDSDSVVLQVFSNLNYSMILLHGFFGSVFSQTLVAGSRTMEESNQQWMGLKSGVT